MRVRGVSGMLPGLAAAIGFAVAACEVVAQDCNLPSGAMSEMTVLFDRVNADRIGRGLDPLRMSAPLTIAAQLYACKLAAQGAAASPHPAQAYIEIRSAGCRPGVYDDAVTFGPVTAADLLTAAERQVDWRRAALSPRMGEVGLGIAVSPEAAPRTIWVMTVASGC